MIDFNNFETSYKHVNGRDICVYCGNSDLVIDDAFDEHGNYRGTRYYCTCEQAKIEQKMKGEIAEQEKRTHEIMKKYKQELEHNSYEIQKQELCEGIGMHIDDYIIYGELKGMTIEEFIQVAKEAYHGKLG